MLPATFVTRTRWCFEQTLQYTICYGFFLVHTSPSLADEVIEQLV
jgi:hypothetical protein